MSEPKFRVGEKVRLNPNIDTHEWDEEYVETMKRGGKIIAVEERIMLDGRIVYEYFIDFGTVELNSKYGDTPMWDEELILQEDKLNKLKESIMGKKDE